MGDLWNAIYNNYPSRNEKEAVALKLLAEAKSDMIIQETGMSREEYKEFINRVKEYEISNLCGE